MDRSPDRDIRLLFPLPLATIASQASMASIPPLFVDIAQDFDASIGTVGIVRSTSALTAIATALLVGGWIHKHGARPVMVVGGLAGLIGALASATAPSLLMLALAQGIVGVGICCLLASGFAGAGEFFAPEARNWAIGWIVALQSLAWIIGVPAVGFLADAYSWHYGFLVPAFFCLVAIVSALIFAPRLDPQPKAADERTGLLAALADRGGRRWTIGELIAFGVWTAEITYIAAFYIEEFEVSVATVGLLLPLGSLAFMVGSAFADRVARRIGIMSMLVWSSVAMGVVAALLFNYHPFLVTTATIGISMGIVAGLRAAGSSTLALDQLPDKPGAMMAARTGATQLGYLLGAALGGLILDFGGYGALGLWMVLGMTTSALVMRGVPTKSLVSQR